jgi:hypothetical protein
MLNLIFLNPKMLVNLLSLLRGTLKLKIHFIFFCVVFKEHVATLLLLAGYI